MPSTASLPHTAHPLVERACNLVRFARHQGIDTMDPAFAGDFAFRDAGSRFSLLKSPGTSPGPDECFGLFARDARPLFTDLLGLHLTWDGLDADRQAAIRPYNSMAYHRSHIVEHVCFNGLQPATPVSARCTMWFAAADVLCIRYRLENHAGSAVPLGLAWTSTGHPGDDATLEATASGFRFANRHSVMGRPYRSRAELVALGDDLRFAVEGTTARSDPIQRELPPHGELEIAFVVRFAFEDEAFPELPADPCCEADLERAIAAEEAAYRALPELPPDRRHHLPLTLKAAGTLRSLRYRDVAPDGRALTTIHAGKTGCGATWFWDTGATLPGLAILGEREAASGALRLLASGIGEDGRPPVTYEVQDHVYHGHQHPILCWGAAHFLERCPDPALLAELYPPLRRYARHWLDRFRGANGLVRHPPGPSCLDDALRWHSGTPLELDADTPWHRQEWGRMDSARFACPDMNAFLVLELRSLAAMAEALKEPDEAAGWRAEADHLAAAVNEHLFDPETGTYQDLDLETGAHNRMISAGSFVPVYAGLASEARARSTCERYLLDEAHFLTALPFPTLDRAHPAFRPGGFLHEPTTHPGSLVQHAYWQGRTWLHVDVWLLGALWRSGFEAEADAIAERILTVVERSEGICECYDSLTGVPNGHPEFMWSAAAVLAIAHGFYRCDPVATL